MAELNFAYHAGEPVLRDVSHEFAPGITVVLGPNGAGKSTLLRLLLGVLKPTRGSITLSSAPVHELNIRRRAQHFAYVAQRPQVGAALTVSEVVSLGRFALGRDEESVHRALNAMSLTDLQGVQFQELSVGQQQRVMVARAIAQISGHNGQSRGERFLLADEPLSAMDPAWVVHTTAELKRIAANGINLVLVLHDFTLAARVADSFVLLDRSGTLMQSGPMSAVRTQSLEDVFGVSFIRAEVEGQTIISPVAASIAPGEISRG